MQIRSIENGYILCLNLGDKVMESLKAITKEKKIPSALISGVGAIKDVELGFYHLDKKHYDKKFFKDDHELLNLSGNISWFNNEPVVHCHLTMGDTEFRAIGGHLFEATVAVTVEITLLVNATEVLRQFHPEIGLNLWKIG